MTSDFKGDVWKGHIKVPVLHVREGGRSESSGLEVSRVMGDLGKTRYKDGFAGRGNNLGNLMRAGHSHGSRSSRKQSFHSAW